MAAHGAYRLLRMADNLSNIIGIEYLLAAQGIDLLRPLTTSAPLARAHGLLRVHVPPLGDDRLAAPDIKAATELVQSGRLITTVNLAELARIEQLWA
jgi:histidine ammonia-lyase